MTKYIYLKNRQLKGMERIILGIVAQFLIFITYCFMTWQRTNAQLVVHFNNTHETYDFNT